MFSFVEVYKIADVIRCYSLLSLIVVIRYFFNRLRFVREPAILGTLYLLTVAVRA